MNKAVTVGLIYLMFFVSCAEAQRGTIRPKWGAGPGTTYVWDGSELRNQFDVRDSWVFDGRELRPKNNYDRSNIYIWDGEILAPKFVHTAEDIWTWDGTVLKRKFGTDYWRLRGRYWSPSDHVMNSETWVVTGDIPVPVAAAVFLDLVVGP